jgi:hypothetical protein
MTNDSERAYAATGIEWIIEYEETDLDDGLWCYKIDHEPIADGGWHALNARTKAQYRIAGKLFQFVAPDKQTPPAEFDSALRTFAAAGRLSEAGVLEVHFRKRQTGYELYSCWLLHRPGVMIPEMRADLLPQAYQDLLVQEQRADAEK